MSSAAHRLSRKNEGPARHAMAASPGGYGELKMNTTLVCEVRSKFVSAERTARLEIARAEAEGVFPRTEVLVFQSRQVERLAHELRCPICGSAA